MRTCIASCCCFYGWVVWIVLAVGQITVFLGASSGVTFIIQPVRDELNLTQTSVAFAYTIGTAFSALVQLPIGRSVDRWGGRMGVVVYSAAFYASVTCLSLPTNWTNLAVAFGLLRAFGVGGLELAANTCLQQWFERRRGLATGLLQSLNAILSYAGISNVVAALVHAFGWRMTYWYLGLLLVCTYTPLAALLLRSRPEDVGMLPDGVPSEPAVPPWAPAQPLACARESASEEAESDTMEATATRLASGRAAKGNGSSSMAPEEPWTLSEAIRTRTFVILALGNAFAWGIGSGVFFNLVSITSEAHLPVGSLAPCLYVPWALSRATAMAVAGWALDHMAPRFLLCLGLLMGGVGIGVLTAHTLTPAHAVAFGVLHGLGNGASSLTFRAAPAKFFGRHHLGAISGVLSMMNVGSTAIGPLLVGASFDLFDSYTGCMRFISVLTIGMGLLTLQMHAPSRNGMGRAAGKPEATGKNCGDEEALATEPQRDQWRQELADETQPRALMSCTLATKEVTVGTPACTPTSREQQLSEAITPVLESKADDAKPSRSKKGRIHRPQAYSKLA